MHIRFFGATREVTGSKFIVETGGKKILFECGMFQGRRKESEEKNRKLPFNAGEIEYMVLSHAHIDHSGSIPNLIKSGFDSEIYATPATVDLLNYMLLDSAHIQERDAEYINKKHKNEGTVEPLYRMTDAEEALEHFSPTNYHQPIERIIRFEYYDAGHILGSAEVLMEVEGKRILFTGDLGRKHLPIIRDPEVPEDVDILIMESTYGNRLHRDIKLADSDVERIVKDAVSKGGKIIIPSFAVERAQEIVYSLNNLIEENRIPPIPIYVDSPLTVDVTEVFMRHTECMDEEAKDILKENRDIFGFHRVHYITDVEESKELNHKEGPMIIISASGMCEHGRILHHLKNSIENERNIILIVGYQAKNTLGRKLVDGGKYVNIFGTPYQRRAKVEVLHEFSAHADKNGLINFAKRISPERIFLVHGEDSQMVPLGKTLQKMGFRVDLPEFGDGYEIH